MTRVYGGCIEPGGMDLEDRTEEVPCPRCGKPALRRYVELCELGSINTYDYVRCYACGYCKGEAPDYWPASGWFDPEDPAYVIPDDDEDADPPDDPDGDLQDETEGVVCPRCGKPAVLHHLEVRGGEVEVHEGRGFTSCHFVRCDACGLNADDFPLNPFKPAPSPGCELQRDEDTDPPAEAEAPGQRGGGMRLTVCSAGLLLLGAVLGLSARRMFPGGRRR